MRFELGVYVRSKEFCLEKCEVFDRVGVVRRMLGEMQGI